ncbi:hypothetical protein HG530_004349 [Fusarium avenaceum]|nr:hypothetical protein HG530_004349 [Fusarium avenaceum]
MKTPPGLCSRGGRSGSRAIARARSVVTTGRAISRSTRSSTGTTAGGTATGTGLGTSALGTSSLLGVVADIGTGVGELKIGSLLGGAAVANVGDKHLRAVAHGRCTLTGASTNGDGGTVHVHLTVTNLVEPGPGEDGLAGGSVTGNLEVEGGSTSAGAVADVGVDDLPRLTLIKGERGLATATTVVSTTGDAHVVGITSCPVSNRSTLRGTEERVVALAGEVGAAGLKRSGHAVVDVAASVGVGLGFEGGRVDHLHMCLGQTSQTEAESDSVELHFVVVTKFVFWGKC